MRITYNAAVDMAYNDPEYQPVKDLRHRLTSRGQAVVVPEFTPAG